MAMVNRRPDKNLSDFRRASDRYRLILLLGGQNGAGEILDIVVEDLSAGGFSFQPSRKLVIGDLIVVDRPDSTQLAAKIVWQTADRCGCKFERRLSRSELAILRLKAEPKISNAETMSSIETFGGQHYSRRVRAIIWIAGATLPWMMAYVALANPS